MGMVRPIALPVSAFASRTAARFLEIRLVGCRNAGVLVRVVVIADIIMLYIFGADAFLKVCVPGAQISNRSLPRRRERAALLDCEFELQAPAARVVIDAVSADKS